MNFKSWLEHEHLYDDLDSNFQLGTTSEKAKERQSASQVFIGKTKTIPNLKYDPKMPIDSQSMFGNPPKEYQEENPDWRDRFSQFSHETIPPEINLKNKRIVCSKYRHPPIAQPILNKDPLVDHNNGRKPAGGLWYAFGNDWIDWSQQVPHRIRMFIHEIKVDTRKMVILDSKEKTNLFEKDYGIKRKIPGSQRYETLINWINVVRDYGGIEIQKNGLHFSDWQEYWDIASGCIWNQHTLKDSRLLYVYDINKREYVRPEKLGVYSGKASRIKRPLPPI